MAGFNYGNSVLTANRLLKKFGSPSLLKRVVKAFDAKTGKTASSILSGTVWVVQMDVKDAQKEMGAIVLVESDQASWVSNTAGFDPQVDDTIVITDPATKVAKTWKVGPVLPLRPGGTTILYKIVLKE